MNPEYADARNLIDQRYHAQFDRLLDTGEINDEGFMQYLETDSNAQRALDIVLEHDAPILRAVAQEIGKICDEISKKHPLDGQ